MVAPSSNGGGTVYLVGAVGGLQGDDDIDDVAELSWDANTDGWSLDLGAGDVDGDGYGDLVVSDSSGSGAVWVHLGPLNTLEATLASTTLTGRSSNSDRCGEGLVLADFDDDGLDDLSVWCSGYTGSGAKGAVATWFGAGLADGDVEGADSLILGGSHEALGTGMGAGDVNGDGVEDLVLGAPEGDTVLVFFGGPGL